MVDRLNYYELVFSTSLIAITNYVYGSGCVSVVMCNMSFDMLYEMGV